MSIKGLVGLVRNTLKNIYLYILYIQRDIEREREREREREVSKYARIQGLTLA